MEEHCLLDFLRQLNITCLGMVLPIVGWGLLHSLTVKAIPAEITTDVSDEGNH